MSITNAPARLMVFKLFEGLGPEELNNAGKLVDERFAAAGEVLHRQGEMPTELYLVESGEVLVEGKDSTSGRTLVRRVAEAGDLVGRRAAVDNVRHLASATVQRDASLLVISLGNLRMLLNLFPMLGERLARTEIVNRLMALPLFGGFNQGELLVLADLVRVVTCVAGQIIFRQGELADAMYIIDTGQVVQTIDGSPLGASRSDGTWPKYLAAGSFFGRFGLRTSSARRATATAATEVRLFRINRQGFEWLLEYKPEFAAALKRPDMLGYLGATTLFRDLSLADLKLLSGYVGLAHYRPGTTVIRQGETDQILYIMYEGMALARGYDAQGHPQPPEALWPGAVLGEHSLFLNDPHRRTVEAPVPSSWLYLSHDDLERYLSARPEARAKLTVTATIQERQSLKRFSWMDPDEGMIFRKRRHWWPLLEGILVPLLPMAAGLFLLFLPIKGLYPLFRILGYPLLVGGALWLLWNVLNWRNDFNIVTTKRVVHIEKVIALKESRIETPLDKVQNINMSRSAVGNYLGFGTLVIETAATFGGAQLKFDRLANPQRVQELIFQEMGRVRAGRRQETQRVIRDKLAGAIGAGNQPYVPPVATAAYTGTEPEPVSSGWRARLSQLPWRSPFWTEQKLTDRVIWRKHPIRLLLLAWPPTLLIVAVLGLLVVLVLRNRALPPVPILVVAVVVLLPTLGWWLWQYANWSNDQYIVTNDRLIDVEKLPLGLRSKRTETTFDKVQNVSFLIPNLLATILNYGTVVIHTAGAQGQLDFFYVRRPSLVQAEIFRRLSAYNDLRRRREQEDRWADLPEWFASFAELQRRNQP